MVSTSTTSILRIIPAPTSIGKPPPVAKVEARRGTSDLTYLVYTLGKLQIIREDYKRLRGEKFTLLDFHNRFMEQGGLPLTLVRRAMLGNDSPTL